MKPRETKAPETKSEDTKAEETKAEGETKAEAPAGDSGKSAADYKIVLLLPRSNQRPKLERNQLYAGLQECNNTLGTNIEYVENVQASDFESTFREYAERL